MQYITTRSERNVFDEHNSLCADTAPDGGFFIPADFPKFSREDIIALQKNTTGEIIADILNKFFSVQLTGWDIDLLIGRNTARLASVGGKMHVAEMWHNPSGTLGSTIESLYKCVAGDDALASSTQWFAIAANIAILFALYSNLARCGVCSAGAKIDISVNAEDMTFPLVACYAREMGLPIGTVLISSSESVIWDLVHRGETNVSGTSQPVIAGLERLVQHKLGFAAVSDYLSSITNKRTYFVDEELVSHLGKGLFCVVAGKNRYQQIIASFALSNHYILEPSSAYCVNALQDYRAKTGVNNHTLILSTVTPLKYIGEITAATRLAEQSILQLVKHS